MTRIAAVLLVLLSTRGVMAADLLPDVARVPDAVHVQTEGGAADLAAGLAGGWAGGGVVVRTAVAADGLRVTLSAPSAAAESVRLRWIGPIDPATRMLADAWERGYGDLGWRPMDAKRPMPWYFLAHAGDHTDGLGVLTGPHALCCWSADLAGVTLTIDVRSGGVGVHLGGRTLDACTVVARRGPTGEDPFDAAVAFCRKMCPRPRLTPQPVYGFNDWYSTYDQDTAQEFLRDAAALAALAPAGENRPFMVVDDGWEASRQGGHSTGDPWDRTNARFGSTMPELARRVKAMNARPGLWYRPLEAWPGAPESWCRQGNRAVFDPTVPAVLERITADVRRFHDWGFELVKHDFTTNEITGLWGSDMGGQLFHGNAAFADRSRTTAEVILNLYAAIRAGGGDDVVIEGCDTVSHLSAGVFEVQRAGDDTSGKEWPRTRKMGVNTLAFRLPQSGTFYGTNPDCIGLASAGAVPWEKNRQWLDLVARSGAPLFVSWRAELLGPEQADAIRAAFAAAARPQPRGRPLDWMQSRTPARWRLDGREVAYSW